MGSAGAASAPSAASGSAAVDGAVEDPRRKRSANAGQTTAPSAPLLSRSEMVVLQSDHLGCSLCIKSLVVVAAACMSAMMAMLGRRQVTDPHGVVAVGAAEEVVSWGVVLQPAADATFPPCSGKGDVAWGTAVGWGRWMEYRWWWR